MLIFAKGFNFDVFGLHRSCVTAIRLTVLKKNGILSDMNSNPIQKIYVFAAKYPFDVLSGYMPPARQAEIDCCKDVNVRQSKYYAFKLLEIALRDVYRKQLCDVNFVLDVNGKWSCDVCKFSLTHSGCIVAVALSDKPVGLDVEKVDISRFDVKLQNRILCKNEQAFAWQLPDERRALYANKLWTAKEALFKRDGGKTFVPEQTDATEQKWQTVTVNDGKTQYYLTTAGQCDCFVEYRMFAVNLDER